MTATTDIRDCVKLAAAVKSLGGAVPDPLQYLLSAHALLSSPAATPHPESAIVDAALDGSLTEAKLQELLPVAATAAMTAGYARQLARDCEHVLIGAWHRAMKAGAADQVLDSLRKNFTTHAKAIAHARELIDPELTAEAVIQSGKPELVTAWQTLDSHLTVIGKIAAVAAQFGCRPTAQFPQVTEYALAENGKVSDQALMCCAGSLIADSWLFGRPGSHRTSPFFKTALRLNSIAEAQRRYDDFAEIEFDKAHSGPVGGWIDPTTGEMHEDAKPENPYRTKVSTQ